MRVDPLQILTKLAAVQNIPTRRVTPPFEGLEEFDYGLRRSLDPQFDWQEFGQLLLDSKVGQGTCVTLALPDHRTDAVLEEPRADYAGGFQPALLELADGLPFHAFQQVHLDD